MREDVAKLDRLDEQTRFLARTGIETIGELMDRRSDAEAKISKLMDERKTLNNAIRRQSRKGDPSSVQELKERRDAVSAELKKLRREVSLCDGIASRSAQTRDELERLLEEQESKERRKEPDELLRRRGGAGREDGFGGR